MLTREHSRWTVDLGMRSRIAEKRPGLWRFISALGLGIVFLGAGACSSDNESSAGGSGQGTFSATITGGGAHLADFEVVLFQAGAGDAARELGRGVSDQAGIVSFAFSIPDDQNFILYATAQGSPQ